MFGEVLLSVSFLQMKFMKSSLNLVPLFFLAAVYGIAMNHPAFKNVLPTFLSLPIISHIAKSLYPLYYDVYTFESLSFNPVEAKALVALVFTVLFGLRVYNVHWSKKLENVDKKKNGRKAAGAAAIRRVDGEKL